MPDLAELSDAARQDALERYRKLQPHLEQNVPLLRVAREAALPLRTARRWVQRYRRFGLAGLTRRDRADHGKRRSISPALLELVEGLALQKPPLPVAAIYREICRTALAQEQPCPSYHSVYTCYQCSAGRPENLGSRRRRRLIAKPTTWFIGVKQPIRTRSGKPITPSSISGPNGPTARQSARPG